MNRLLLIFLIFCSEKILSHPGVGIVIDSKGNVFYTDLKHIWKIAVNGKVSIAVKNVHSHELYLDKNDNLFGEHLWYEGEASDKWGHYVWRLSPSGQLEKIIPPTEGFLTDYSFVHDNNGHMIWADRKEPCQKIMRKNSDNSTTSLSNHCFSDIRWVATHGTSVYLVDHHDLKKINEKGTVQTLATNLAERKLTQFTVNDQHLAMGVWTDKNENAYVAMYGARKVKRITPDKKVSDVFETSIFWSPTGGVVAPNGDFWLLECSPVNQVRVEKITTKGDRIIYSGTDVD